MNLDTNEKNQRYPDRASNIFLYYNIAAINVTMTSILPCDHSFFLKKILLNHALFHFSL